MFAIIMLIICFLSAGGYFAYTKYYLPRVKIKNEQTQKQSANLAINVKDFGENEIFTLDNNVISIFRITPINVELFTAREKTSYIEYLTASLSSIKIPYKIIAFPRPFDIHPFIEALNEQKKQANDNQKEFINDEIASLQNLVT